MTKTATLKMSSLAAAAGLALLAGLTAPGSAMPVPPASTLDQGTPHMLMDVQYRRWGGWHGGYYRHRGWNAGGAAAAGVAGLAAGAILGGALAQPRYYDYGQGYTVVQPAPVYVDPPTTGTVYGGASADVSYCMQRFRSYDPASGTYLGYDGLRHPCP
jgi:hypothetical protein